MMTNFLGSERDEMSVTISYLVNGKKHSTVINCPSSSIYTYPVVVCKEGAVGYGALVCAETDDITLPDHKILKIKNDFIDGVKGAFWIISQTRHPCRIKYIEHFLDGKRHNDKGAAVDHHYMAERAPIQDIRIEYWQYGMKHRANDLPAVSLNDGEILEWWYNNLLDRDGDQPAVIHHGSPMYVEFRCRGLRHRGNDKPAVLEFDCNGREVGDFWEGGDSWVNMEGDFIYHRAEWWTLDKRHHDIADRNYPEPAIQEYDDDGDVTESRYFFNGEEYFPETCYSRI
jgi:hypothetical protein